ncbi:hypothetical protein COLO4_31046 [Corchorus olitorius]|uniref:Uncharacterized protein n=1 Tax=Corchorus olitorius TaxID=93759 RepID=A0A1R3H622_9ROSI|nr:hypothetical protein COLO4_31046 [Corchorus olitorius]
MDAIYHLGSFVYQEYGADKWDSLQVPPLLASGAHKTCCGAYVSDSEDGKKILVLVHDPSNYTQFLWIYDAKSNDWDHQHMFSPYYSPPDYTIPVNDLDLLLHSNSNTNNSFVINGGVKFAREALLQPLGLLDAFVDVLPPVSDKADFGRSPEELVRLDTWRKPEQYKIENLEKKCTDIAIFWDILLPCTTIVPCRKLWPVDQQASSSSMATGGRTLDSGLYAFRSTTIAVPIPPEALFIL